MMLRKGYIQTDQPAGMYYKNEDTEWGIWPDEDDAGLLVPKPGAVPVSYEEAHTNDPSQTY